MTDQRPRRTGTENLPDTVGKKASRRLKAQQTGQKGVWFGMGMFGLVGWSVVTYTVLGVILGSWIDRRWPSAHSWTLTLLIAGLIAGCVNAWYWVQKESGPGDDQDDC